MRREIYSVKIVFIVMLAAFVCFAWAQDYYHVYRNGELIYGASGENIDSVKVEGATAETIKFYEGANVDFSIARTYIDSIIINTTVPLLPNVQNVTAAPGFNRALVKWDQNPNPAIEKAVVYWNNRADSVELSVTIAEPGCFQTDSVFITGLTEGQNYQFEVINKNTSGQRSGYVAAGSSIQPYGESYKAGLEFRQVEFLKMQLGSWNSANHNATDTLWLAAKPSSSDYIGQRIFYKKQPSGIATEIILPASDSIAVLTEVGNNLLDDDHVINLTSLYKPFGGIDIVETDVYKTQLCAYVAKNLTQNTVKRFGYNAGKWWNGTTLVGPITNGIGNADPEPKMEDLYWGTFASQVNVPKPTTDPAYNSNGSSAQYNVGEHPDVAESGYTAYVWSVGAQKDMTVFKTDRTGTFSPNWEKYIREGQYSFVWTLDKETNKVSVSGRWYSYNGRHEDYVFVENGAASGNQGGNEDFDPAHSAGDGTPQSIYNPVTRSFNMNFAIWRIGQNGSNKQSVVWVATYEPR